MSSFLFPPPPSPFFTDSVFHEQCPLLPLRPKTISASGCCLPAFVPRNVQLHSIQYFTVYVEVLAPKAVLLSQDPITIPGHDMNSRPLILSPKLFLFAQNDQSWPRAPYLI